MYLSPVSTSPLETIIVSLARGGMEQRVGEGEMDGKPAEGVQG